MTTARDVLAEFDRVEALLEAIHGARFAMHCELLGTSHDSKRAKCWLCDPDERIAQTAQMSGEVLGETMVALNAALAAYEDTTPACSGCNHHSHAGSGMPHDPVTADAEYRQALAKWKAAH